VRRWTTLLFALFLPAAAEADERVRTLTRALLLLDARESPPPDDTPGWEAVTLPDAWRERRPERSGFAWYRLELPGRPAPGEPWALHLPSLGMNAAAWVNGEPVGSGGRFEEPVARNFNRPLYFTFPSALLSREGNLIHVRLWAYATPQHGYLAPLRIGPDASLRGAFAAQAFWQEKVPELSTWVTLTMVFFLGALWVGHRFDGVYGWFVLAASFWALASLNAWVHDVPVSTWTWERLVSAPIEGFAVSLALWVHRFLDIHAPRVERALLAFGGGSIAATLLLPASALFPTVLWLHAGSLAVGTYAVVRLFARLPAFPPWQAAVYVAGGLLCLALGGHDLAVQLGWLPPTSPLLLPFVVLVLLLVFGATLTARFVGSLRAAEALSRELEVRVAQKHAELEQSWVRTRELERAHVLARERERLMREMHDGLGGHLVSALSLAEAGDTPPEDLAWALRGALDEMRVVIDSLDPQVEDLGQLLGQLRARLERVLERSGLRFRWDVGRGHALPALGPEQALHVLRILQEAVTNVVRHAAAREVSVWTQGAGHGAAGVTLAIRDDGRGGAGSRDTGRGIANMRERARLLGGTLRVRDAAPGTVVELELPLTPPSA
jgi:signal transduction histidine kinase